MGKFVIRKTKTGYVYNLKASNGEVIANGQVYKSLAACKKGVASVAKNAAVAGIEDQTAADIVVVKNPKFEVYTDRAGEARFRLKASNGQVIASSEGYKSMKSCMAGIASVQKNAPEAPVVIEEE